MMQRAAALALTLTIAFSPQLAAQERAAGEADTSRLPAPRGGADLGIPLASFFVPGLGQYLDGSWLAGAALTSASVGGYALYVGGDAAAGDPPRTAAGQRAFIGAGLMLTAGGLSTYDSFHRSLPLLQRAGKYDFAQAHDPSGSLLLAPFDLGMLKRWTTWIDLAHTALVTAILVRTETEPGAQYLPFRTSDGAFVAAFSYNAGVGEEALFRGWLYPMLYQNLGRRFWLANGLQAGTFGALHAPQAGSFALVIASSALYEGWVTRRNGWSIRESVFHHFWYDVTVGAASLLTQKTASVVVVVPVRF
jgi:membrane protease YdiL (CAAX protease family)